jgi:hypothetical protein
MVETLLKHRLPHPPLTLLFTVREESGLHGSRELDPKDLGGAKMCFNVDTTHANKLIIAAERGAAVGHDPVALADGFDAGTERDRIQVAREEQAVPLPRPRKLHDQIPRLGRHRYLRVGVVEPDGRCRHPDLLQRGRNGLCDRLFLAGDAVHRQKVHQVGFSGTLIKRYVFHPILLSHSYAGRR